MYLTRLELITITIIGIGAIIVSLGLSTLALGHNETAVTMLLAVPGICLWIAGSEA